MAQGKPYRYGLIAAGLCVGAVGLFIMVQERPHVYATACALGITMVCVGTVWSLCQCYPKVILVPESEEKSEEGGLVCKAAGAKEESLAEAPPASRHLQPALKNHSCPTLHLV